MIVAQEEPLLTQAAREHDVFVTRIGTLSFKGIYSILTGQDIPRSTKNLSRVPTMEIGPKIVTYGLEQGIDADAFTSIFDCLFTSSLDGSYDMRSGCRIRRKSTYISTCGRRPKLKIARPAATSACCTAPTLGTYLTTHTSFSNCSEFGSKSPRPCTLIHSFCKLVLG